MFIALLSFDECGVERSMWKRRMGGIVWNIRVPVMVSFREQSGHSQISIVLLRYAVKQSVREISVFVGETFLNGREMSVSESSIGG